MDKYQLNFVKGIIISVNSSEGDGTYDLDNEGTLIIVQNKNYNITKYTLQIKNKNFTSISYYNNTWNEIILDNDVISIPIDFDNPISIIKIKLKEAIIDDIEVKVILKKSNKQSWDEEVLKELYKNCECALCTNSDATMHTIIFKPCCKEYSYSIVKWYATMYKSNNHYNNSWKSISSPYLLIEEKIQNRFYSNIETAGLHLYVVILQYDKNNNLLISKRVDS